MKPLFTLIITFAISLMCLKFTSGIWQWATAGKIAMAVMLILTAIGHFKFPEGMAMMMPSIIPFKTELVYLTGILEMAASVGLLIPGTQLITAWCLIVFFILILPANIYASIHHVNFEKATYEGQGISYLWFRIPLQLFFIAWVYCSVLIAAAFQH